MAGNDSRREEDEAILESIGTPRLPEIVADCYMELVNHSDASLVNGSTVEKRLSIDLTDCYRRHAEKYLDRHPRSTFSVSELINLIECSLRGKGLVKRWIDSVATGGPMEPLTDLSLQGEGTIRVFAVEDFEIGGEIRKMVSEHRRRITEEEKDKVWQALVGLDAEGPLGSYPSFQKRIAETTGLTKARVNGILKLLMKEGKLQNPAGMRRSSWQVKTEKKEAEPGAEPRDVILTRLKERQSQLSIELEKVQSLIARITSGVEAEQEAQRDYGI